MTPFLAPAGPPRARHRLYVGTLAAIGLAVGLAALQWVVLKMLPFDNKSEFQVVDMPEGTPVETTARVLASWRRRARRAGGHGLPGLRGHRRADQLQRARAPVLPAQRRRARRPAGQPRRQARARPKSHEIARRAAGAREIGRAARRVGAGGRGAAGPAGDGAARRRGLRAGLRRSSAPGARAARAVRATPDIVDTDDSVEAPMRRAARLVGRPRRTRRRCSASRSRRSPRRSRTALGGLDATYVHDGREVCRSRCGSSCRSRTRPISTALLLLPVRSASGALVPLSDS
jgi:multidrug efflux pump subunit AcrB